MMKLSTLIPYLKKIQKNMNHVTHLLTSTFFHRNQQILLANSTISRNKEMVGGTFFFRLLILNRVNDLYYKGRFFVRLILLLNYVKLLRGTKNTENLRQYKSRFSLFVDQTGFCFKHLMSPNLKQIA